jgi:hypothetical protein
MAWHHSLVAAFDDVILFTATHYAPVQGLPYGPGANDRDAELLFVFSLAAVLAVAVYVPDRYVGRRAGGLRVSDTARGPGRH